MPIATNHVFGLMANPRVNCPLVDPSRGTIATKRVSEHMPTSQVLPRSTVKSELKATMHLSWSKWHR